MPRCVHHAIGKIYTYLQGHFAHCKARRAFDWHLYIRVVAPANEIAKRFADASFKDVIHRAPCGQNKLGILASLRRAVKEAAAPRERHSLPPAPASSYTGCLWPARLYLHKGGLEVVA